MLETRVILSGLWVATMLTYLLGDVLRIMAGHVKPGEIMGKVPGQGTWMAIAAIMVVPICMLVASLLLPQSAARWANLIVATLFVLFNLAGITGYQGHYDRFLLIVSFVFNGLTVWYAWKWVPAA